MSDTIDGAETPLPKVLTLTFEEPITFNGKQYTEVTVCEPTTQQFADAQDFGGVRSVQHLVHVTGKVPNAVAALMLISYTMEADRFFSRFTRAVPRT